MKATEDIMGMPVTVEIRDAQASEQDLRQVFAHFHSVDKQFSTYKPDSEISRINRLELALADASVGTREVFRLSAKTNYQTRGYFDIMAPGGGFDPSGLVKGWAIYHAAQLLEAKGFREFFVEAGGDLQVRLADSLRPAWRVGIRSPFNQEEIVKVVSLHNQGMATSGSYERGQHVYNPYQPQKPLTEILSVTVIGPNVYEADRFATAAFAMGPEGIKFLEQQPELEGYQIDRQGVATQTTGFEQYVRENPKSETQISN